VHELSQLLKQEVPECLFHTDATQAVGKISVDLTSLKGVDFLSLSAHKFHGPKGIGALFKRKGLQLRSWVIGGGQQSGRRAGTENPGLAAGLAKAIELIGSAREIQSRARSIRSLRDRLENGCCQKHPGTKIAGDAAPRLPNTSLMVFPHSEGEMLVHHLLNDGIVASTGAACSKGSDLPSHVLTSMGFDYTIARNSLRLSLSRETTDRHIDCCLRSLESAPGSA